MHEYSRGFLYPTPPGETGTRTPSAATVTSGSTPDRPRDDASDRREDERAGDGPSATPGPAASGAGRGGNGDDRDPEAAWPTADITPAADTANWTGRLVDD